MNPVDKILWYILKAGILWTLGFIALAGLIFYLLGHLSGFGGYPY